MFVPTSIKSYIPLFCEYEVVVVGVILVSILLYIVPESILKTCHDMIMARTSVCP